MSVQKGYTIMIIQNSNLNFKGIRFPYRANVKEAKKIADFIENENNFNLIKKLNLTGTDIYFSDDIKKIGFAHQQYGNLDKYGAENVTAEKFSSASDDILQSVVKAIKKVQKVWADNSKESRRGC